MVDNAVKMKFIMIDTREKQLDIKKDFQDLFLDAFKKPMSDVQWEHFYINCPVGQTISFVCYDGALMVAHGGLIPQRLLSKSGEKIDYFLQTAIMVREKYQTLVLFKELLDRMTDYVTNHRSFVVAYPNKNTYLPFVKMLGWRMVRQYDIGQYVVKEGAVTEEKIGEQSDFEYEINKDAQFIRWRGESNGSKSLKTADFEIIYKDYYGSLEILDVSVSGKDIRIQVCDILKQLGCNSVNVAECFLGLITLDGLAFNKKVGIPQRMCFYPAEYDECRYDRIRPSLLISDVF